MKIDFIAYHQLQAQTAESVFEELSYGYSCRWLMGPFNGEAPADIGILLDHRGYHDVTKSRWGYSYLFHMSHDLADVEVYKKENLHDFDIIFVPTSAHRKSCLEAGYDANRVKIVGWPKYDNIEFSKTFEDVAKRIRNNSSLSILYAPTFASNYEWKQLFPFFQKLDCRIFVKNHIYVDEGQILPREIEYQRALASVREMEMEANKMGFSVIPSNENICNHFDSADILISDSSSCLAEFLPFGISIETGGGAEVGSAGYAPEVCLMSRDVLLCSVDKLVNFEPKDFFNLVKIYSFREKPMMQYNKNHSAGVLISNEIISYISKTPPRYESLFKSIVRKFMSVKQKIRNT